MSAMRMVLCALTCSGCNLVFGLDPVATATDGDAAIDGSVIDGDAIDGPPGCQATPGPGAPGPRRIDIASHTLKLDAATAVGTDHYLFGVDDTTTLRDAVVIRHAAGTTEAWTVGGGFNDLLFGAASDGTSALGVGVTRSFLGSFTGDAALVVKASPSGVQAFQIRPSNDSGASLSAVQFVDSTWLVAGRHQSGARVLVAELDGNAQVQRAVSVGVGDMVDVQVRAMVVGDHQVFLLGSAPTGRGFVLALPRADLMSGGWAVELGFLPFDGQWRPGELDVIGNLGGDSIRMRIADSAGALIAAQRFDAVRLQLLTTSGGQTWVGGPVNGGVLLGTLTGDCVAATLHADLEGALPLAAALPFVDDGVTRTLYGTLGAGIAIRPVDATGTSTCGQLAQSVVAAPSPLMPTALGTDSAIVTLTTESLTSAVVPTLVTVVAGCN